MIYAISGKIGSGKTTLAELLKENLISKGRKVEIVNFADKLKEICFLLTGYYGKTQEEKNIYIEEYGFTVGEALQLIGTNAMRNNYHKDVWVISTFKNMKPDTDYIIADCRFKNEADFCNKNNAKLIRIDGDPADTRKSSKRDLNHPSETDLDDYHNWGYYFYNDKSIEELKNFANFVINN